MKDARRRRFRKEPDLNPELVQRVEKDLIYIMNGGNAENLDVDITEQDKAGDVSAHYAVKEATLEPATNPKNSTAETNVREPDRSDSDESDYSI